MSGEFDHRLRAALRTRATQAEGVDDVMGDVDRRYRRHTRNRRTAGAALCLAVLTLAAVAGVPALGPGGDDIEFADPREGEVDRADDGDDGDDLDTETDPDPDDAERGEADEDGEPDGEAGAAETEPSEEEEADGDDSEPTWAECAGEVRGVEYELSYPAGWWTPEGGVSCEVFHPEPYDLPEDPNQVPGVAIRLTVLDAPIDEVADPSLADVRLSEDERITGRPGRYQEGTEDGDRFARYLVDLGERTMLLRTTEAADAGSYQDNRGVLRAIADSLSLDVDALDDGDGSDDDGAGFDDDGEPVMREPDGLGADNLLTEIRAGSHEEYDRVVFEFAGEDVPGYEFRHATPPFHHDPSGKEVDVDGEAWIETPDAPGISGTLNGAARPDAAAAHH